MSISKTYGVKDEELPWRALAEAVIVQAVKDYRICSQRIRQIQNRLHRRTGITSAEAIEQNGVWDDIWMRRMPSGISFSPPDFTSFRI